MIAQLIISFLCFQLVVGTQIPLWPLPKDYTFGQDNLILNQQFRFAYESGSASNSILDNAFLRYNKLFKIPSTSVGPLTTCSVSVSQSTIPSIIDSDESYTLDITSSGQCSLTAKTTWGMLHALETFSQLLIRDISSHDVILANSPIHISDIPRFGHRGMLIDTSRHYLSTKEIKRIVDTLPINKFNVLHWHIVDAESFPLNTPSEPTMVKGAYSPQMTYEMSDLTDIYNYAHARGVEIIFEIDIPGHAASWTAGKKSIMADCFAKYYYNINDFALNPTLDETYTTIQHILSDVVQATGIERIHLGGDEVVYGCWKNDSSITTFMNENHMTSYDQLMNYFVQNVDTIANKLNTHVTHWEEVFTAGCKVSSDTTFQVWTDSTQISAVTSAHYNVIASPSNYWYLNIATNTWQNMYTYDPYMNLTTSQQAYILGGEVALWGEYIDDYNIEQNIYPRASSVGERLWSPSTVNDVNEAVNRLIVQKCRLNNRGIRSAPVQPADYCTTDYV